MPRPPRTKLDTVRFGFIPLLDSAIPFVAVELGFARDEGIDLQLQKEISWANVRDRLNLGHFDAAHMLAGLPIASSLGIGHVMVPTIAPFVLNFNGNAITLSRDLFRMMADTGLTREGDPAAMARALAQVVAENRNRGGEPFTFGVTFPFSCHNYELRYWLASGGIHPDWDVRLVVVPPPLTAETMRAGQIQGFCVGAPWNTLAVRDGVGRIVAIKSKLWHRSTEKVVGMRTAWADANPEIVAALLRAFDRAADWAASPANRESLAGILADKRYVGTPLDITRDLLSGEVLVSHEGERIVDKEFILYRREGSNRPVVDQALWIYSQMVRWRQIAPSPTAESVVRRVYHPGLYDSALGLTAESEGGRESDAAANEVFDARRFDPSRIDQYLAEFGDFAMDPTLPHKLPKF